MPPFLPPAAGALFLPTLYDSYCNILGSPKNQQGKISLKLGVEIGSSAVALEAIASLLELCIELSSLPEATSSLKPFLKAAAALVFSRVETEKLLQAGDENGLVALDSLQRSAAFLFFTLLENSGGNLDTAVSLLRRRIPLIVAELTSACEVSTQLSICAALKILITLKTREGIEFREELLQALVPIDVEKTFEAVSLEDEESLQNFVAALNEGRDEGTKCYSFKCFVTADDGDKVGGRFDWNMRTCTSKLQGFEPVHIPYHVIRPFLKTLGNTDTFRLNSEHICPCKSHVDIRFLTRKAKMVQRELQHMPICFQTIRRMMGIVLTSNSHTVLKMFQASLEIVRTRVRPQNGPGREAVRKASRAVLIPQIDPEVGN